MKKALFIYNPVAGRKQLKFSFDKIIGILGREYELIIRETQGAGDGTNIVCESKTELLDAIICCGGDGTLNEVVNGVLETGLSVPIGYIPCGSTNDFARSLRIPTNPVAAANNILRGSTSPIDIGLFDNSRHFSYIASFGAFTEASYNTPQKEKNTFGHLAYVLRGSKDFFALKRCPTYKVEITTAEGEKIEGEYFFGAVCNSTSVGGLIHLPQSSVDLRDGLFEAVFIKKPKNTKEWLALMDDILQQKIERSSLVDMRKTTGIMINMHASTSWTLDGERATTDGIVTISNQKQAVNIFI